MIGQVHDYSTCLLLSYVNKVSYFGHIVLMKCVLTLKCTEKQAKKNKKIQYVIYEPPEATVPGQERYPSACIEGTVLFIAHHFYFSLLKECVISSLRSYSVTLKLEQLWWV